MSSSQAMTLTAGCSARRALAMPQASAPPPRGTSTASTSGTCSRISSAIVPLPASAAGSRTASMYSPTTCGWPRVSTVCHQRARGSGSIRAPSACSRASLACGVCCASTMTVAAMPRRCAIQASATAAVARAAGVYPLRECRRRPAQHRVADRAQFEGGDGLQVLKLKKDLQARRRRMQRYDRGLHDQRPAGARVRCGWRRARGGWLAGVLPVRTVMAAEGCNEDGF